MWCTWCAVAGPLAACLENVQLPVLTDLTESENEVREHTSRKCGRVAEQHIHIYLEALQGRGLTVLPSLAGLLKPAVDQNTRDPKRDVQNDRNHITNHEKKKSEKESEKKKTHTALRIPESDSWESQSNVGRVACIAPGCVCYLRERAISHNANRVENVSVWQGAGVDGWVTP